VVGGRHRDSAVLSSATRLSLNDDDDDGYGLLAAYTGKPLAKVNWLG